MLKESTMQIATSLLMATCVVWILVTLMPGPALAGTLTPVVVFPAFHFTKLKVKVQHQSVAPACPTSGTFEDWFLNDSPSRQFSQACQDKLLTLVVDPDASRPMPERFANQPGVTVELKDSLNFSQFVATQTRAK
jgi:lysophospholipase-3